MQHLRLPLYLLYFLFVPQLSHTKEAPIHIQEWIQESRFTQLTDQQFILLTFWATWCGPCHQVTPHIEQMQKSNTTDLYVLSLTQESSSIVTKYLQKNPKNTAIAIDNQGQTFQQYKVKALPYAVLLSPSGQKIWTGHPAELNQTQLENIFDQKKDNALPISKKIVQPPRSKSLGKLQTKETPLFTYTMIPDPIPFFQEVVGHQLHLSGKLEKIIRRLFPSPEYNIINQSEEISAELWIDTQKLQTHTIAIIETLLREQNLTLEISTQKIPQWYFTLIHPTKLWNTKVLNWGEDSPDFLIDDRNIKANNQSIAAFTQQLQKSLQINIQWTSPIPDTRHDWDLHIKHIPLMQEQLIEEYGIQSQTTGWTSTDVIVIKNQ